MTKLVKQIVLGATFAGVAGIGVAQADSFEESVAKNKASDNERMDAWRKETKAIIAENAQKEASYRAEAAKLDNASTPAEPDHQNQNDSVKQENEKRKAVYEKSKKEIDERNRAKRAKYHEEYAKYVRYKDRGATMPTVPTYEPLPTLELLDEHTSESTHLADGGSFNLERPEEKMLPHAPKLDFIDFPAENEASKGTSTNSADDQPGIEYTDETTKPASTTNSEVQPELALSFDNGLNKSKPTMVSDSDAKTEIKSDGKTEMTPDVKSDGKTEITPDVKADAKTEIKSDVKADVKSEVKTEMTPDVEVDTKDDAKPAVDDHGHIKKEGEELLEKTSSNVLEKTSSKIDDKINEIKAEGEKPADTKIESEKTKSSIQVNPDTDKLLTVKYVNEKGENIKSQEIVSPSQAVNPGAINGYEYVTSSKDKDTVTHIYKAQTEQPKQDAPMEQPKQEVQQLSQTNTEQKTENSDESSDVAVYVTEDSAKNKQYYYMAATAQAHNTTHNSIVRMSESEAKKEGFSWVGESVEPNPQKTTMSASTKTSNNNGSSKYSQMSTSGTLPHTGDTSSSTGLLGIGFLGIAGALGVRRMKDNK